jgi:hypothetical protein
MAWKGEKGGYPKLRLSREKLIKAKPYPQFNISMFLQDTIQP